MHSAVTALFKEKVGHSPAHVVHAPGRLELLGNHTDYNRGLVMSLAVDRYIHIAAAPRADGVVRLMAGAFDEPEQFPASRPERNPAAPWADYVKGVLDQLLKHGIAFGGFDAAIDGTIPMGAGMSSSAALEVASALIVRQLYPYQLSGGGEGPGNPRAAAAEPLGGKEKLQVARLCQAAENEFVGVKCGLLDQVSCLFGKASHAIEIDFDSITVQHAPMHGDVAIVVCNSGVKHELVGGEYNELRAMCESAARKLGVDFLRAVTPPVLQAGRNKLTNREFECAFHIVGENSRVVVGSKALREGDLAKFGQYMFESHESSRDFFKNSTAELDTLVAIARKQPSCLGARLTGGGFGGATINLVRRTDVEQFSRHMAAEYHAQTGIDMTPLVCRIVDGAQ